jgi:iron complex outermembrane receptor protein
VAANTRRHSDHYVLLRDDPSVYQNVHNSWQTGGEAVARTVSGPVALALGTDAENDQLSSQRLGGRREWRGGLFAEGTVGTREHAMLDAGARVDRSSTFGAFFSPSLATAVRLARGIHLRANGALGFRAPTWTERYYSDPANAGDSTLHSERFASGEIGVATEAAGALLDVAAFARHAENLIDWVRPAGSPTTVRWHATNVGRAEYRGVEGTLTLPPMERLTASLFATALHFTDDQGSALEGKYALRPITEQVGMRLGRSFLHSFDVAGDASIARRAREASHFTGDVHSSWTHRTLRIAADATNLANASWLDASGLPVAGRAFMLSVGWMLGSE